MNVETGFFYDCITNSSCDPTISKQKPLLVWEMATHSSILVWKFPGTGEPGGPRSTGSQSWTRLRDGHTGKQGPFCMVECVTGGGILGRWLLSFGGNMAFHSVQSLSCVPLCNPTDYSRYARPPCPSPTPRACSNSCPLSQLSIQASHPLSLTPKNWPF